jgi:hypothetical protein
VSLTRLPLQLIDCAAEPFARAADELSITSNIQSFRRAPQLLNRQGEGLCASIKLSLYNQPRAQRKVRVSLSLSRAGAERDYMVIGLVPW